MTRSMAGLALGSRLAFLALIPYAGGAIIGVSSLPDLIASSDFVLVGTVAETQHDGATGTGSILIVPSDVLMGSPPPGPLRLTYGAVRPGGRQENLAGRRALVFAARDHGSGELRVVPVVTGVTYLLEQQLFLAGSGVARAMTPSDPGDSAVQRIVRELAMMQGGLQSPVMMTYLMPLAWRDEEAETLRSAFRAMRTSSAPFGFVHGTMGLVGLGGVEGIEALDDALRDGLSEVGGSLELVRRTYRSVDAKGVAIFARWLREGSGELRVAAAAGLARIHTPEAIAVLGPALDHSDFQVQWRAVGGLSMFANNVPIGGGGGPLEGACPFRDENTIRYSVNDEDLIAGNPDYLDFWRRWWTENSEAVSKLNRQPTQAR